MFLTRNYYLNEVKIVSAHKRQLHVRRDCCFTSLILNFGFFFPPAPSL